MRILLSTLFALAVLAPAHAQTAAPSRGQLLYGTHCVECHTTQMHWRAQRLARDWDSLKGQVHWATGRRQAGHIRPASVEKTRPPPLLRIGGF